MIILHGEDIVRSRQHLNQIIETAKSEEQEIRRFESQSLDLTTLTQILEGLTLFGKQPLLVIENFFAPPKSKNKDSLTEFLSQYQDRPITIYENKSLTPTALKPFSQAEVKEYKPAAIIFNFLDSLQPGAAAKSLSWLAKLEDSGEPAELIFAMLVRQVRLLIQALTPSSLRVAPWQRNRLTAQARAFGETRLLSLHQKLYQIDKSLKTGRNPLSLSTQLFNLIASL